MGTHKVKTVNSVKSAAKVREQNFGQNFNRNSAPPDKILTEKVEKQQRSIHI